MMPILTYRKLPELLDLPSFSLISLDIADEMSWVKMVKDSQCEWFTHEKQGPARWMFTFPRSVMDIMLRSSEEGNYKYLVEKKGNEGYIGELYLMFHEKNVTLGYFIVSSQRNQGLATHLCLETIRALKQNALLLDITTIKAEVFPENNASQKVLTKAGFNNLGLKTYDGPMEDFHGKIKFHFELPLRSEVAHILKRHPRPNF